MRETEGVQRDEIGDNISDELPEILFSELVVGAFGLGESEEIVGVVFEGESYGVVFEAQQLTLADRTAQKTTAVFQSVQFAQLADFRFGEFLVVDPISRFEGQVEATGVPVFVGVEFAERNDFFGFAEEEMLELIGRSVCGWRVAH